MSDKVLLALSEVGSEDIMFGFSIERNNIDAFMEAFEDLVKRFDGKDFSELLETEE